MEPDQRVPPITPEAIEALDRWKALIIVASALRAIPDFVRVWKPAYDRLAAALEEARPDVMRRWTNLSPEARGAAMAFGSPSFLAQPDQAQLDGAAYRAEADQLFDAHAGAAFESYRSRIDELLDPLAVEDLANTLLMIDVKATGLFEQLKEAGGVAGPWRDALEAELFRGLTDLGPADLAKTTPGRVRGRIKRKSGRLARHLKTYDLEQRVKLWIMNKVFGIPQGAIASHLQAAGEAVASGDPAARIRRHIRDVNRLFGTHPRGRPQKGGMLAHWNQLAKSDP